MTGLDDEDTGGLALVSSLLPLRMAPWTEEMLTTTTRFRLAFATTVRMVNRVHRHTAHGRTDTLPACAAGLARSLVHVITISNLADGAEATIIKAADFAGRHFHQRPAAIAVGKDGKLARCTSDFATVAGDEFDVVNRCAERHSAQWHRVASLGSNVGTSDDRGPNFQAERGEDVRFLAIFVLDERNTASTVRIIFDPDDRCRSIVFPTLEIDEAIVALVTTTDVAGGDATGVVAATAALERGEEALFRLAFGNLVEGRQILVASGGCDWLESFQGHDNRNVRVLRLELR